MKIFTSPILANITRVLVTALAASLLVMFPGGPAQMAYATGATCSGFSGDGTPGNPMRITTSAHLASISDCVIANPGAGLTYKIVNDIDMSNLGQISPFPIFEGSLIGDDSNSDPYSIYGFSVSGEVSGNAGLFAIASGSATVSNLSFLGTVENTASSFGKTGLLFGHVQGDLTTNRLGFSGSISEAVSGGTRSVGFLAGTVDGYLDISSTDVVQASITAAAVYAGGLVGSADEMEISSADATNLTIDAAGSQSSGNYGGLIGYAYAIWGVVDDSLAWNVDIEATDGKLGGFFGYVSNSNLDFLDTQVRSTTISASDGAVGGFVGHVDMGVEAFDMLVEDTELSSGGDRIGGHFGSIGGSYEGTGISVESVTINASPSSNYVGGVAGLVDLDSYISEVYVYNLLVPTLDDRFGGVFGFITNGGLEASAVTVTSMSATSLDPSQAYMGGIVGSQDGHFTGSEIAVLDTTLNANGSFIGGHVGYIPNGGYAAQYVYLAHVHFESLDAGSVGGFVGSLDGDFTLLDADLFETSFAGNEMFVAGAVGYIANGDLNIERFQSSYSNVVNQLGHTHTAGLAGGIQAGATLSDVSIHEMVLVAGDNFVSFGIGNSAYGELIATNVRLDSSLISISGDADYVGGVAGGTQNRVLMEDVSLLGLEIRGNGAFYSAGIGYGASSHVEVNRATLTNLLLSSEHNDDFMGGLVGSSQTVSFSEILIENSRIDNPGGDWNGGLVGMTAYGQAFDDVSVEYLTVTGVSKVGGLSGGVSSNYKQVSFVNIDIAQLTMETTGQWVGGLAGTIQGGTISDVLASNITVTGDSYIAGLVGASYDLLSFELIELENTSVSALANNVGALGGFMAAPIALTSATLSGTTLVGKQNVGGVFGYTSDFVTASHVQLAFTSIYSDETTSSGDAKVGGIIGFATTERVSLNDVAVGFLGITAASTKVGGIVGWATDGISISNFTVLAAEIHADAYAGGVIGYTTNGLNAEQGMLRDIELTTALGYAGGFAGFSVNTENYISKLGMAYITVSAAGDNAAGFIAYSTVGTTLTDIDFESVHVYNTADVTGGLFGFSVGTLTISRAVLSDFNMSGSQAIGGLIGYSIYGANLEQVLLQDVASTGSSEIGDFIGRLAGDDALLASTQSYIVYGQSSSSAIGMIAGSTGSASLPVEISSAQALETSTFTGWDFNTYFGLRCNESPGGVGLRAIRDGLAANCSAPAPSSQNQVAPVSYVYEGPNFSSISPKLIWSASSIVLTGTKLDLVTGISVDGVALKFTRISATQIELAVPAGLSLGKKDLKVEHSIGSLLVGNAFEVIAPPVVIVPKVTITSIKGRVWAYFKNVTGKALVVKIGSKWHRVPNNGTEVVGFSRKAVKGKTVQVSAYIAGVKVATNSVRVR